MCKIITKKATKEQEAMNINYRCTPYGELPVEDGKRVYLVGQECYGKRRTKLLIEDDYVLTDDNGRYIHTDEVLTREYLMGLSQKQIQGEHWTINNCAYIFLPIPRAEAIYKNLKPIQDRNNIGQYQQHERSVA